MFNMRKTFQLTSTIVVITALIPAVAFAQDNALPDGKAVIERYLEATGGRAAYEKIASRVTHITLEFAAAGIKGKMTIYQVVPNKGLISVDIPATGLVEQGTDGTVVWERSAMMGTRLLDGQEREMMLRGVNVRSELEPEKVYDQIKTIGAEDVDGKPTWKVELTTVGGGKEIRFYDQASGLLLKSIASTSSTRGDFEVVTTHSNYKDMGGIKVSTVLTQESMEQKFVLTIENIELNPTIPPEKFALPDEVKALVAKQNASPATQPR